MGSWGPGIFENDDVMDWFVKLEDTAPTDDLLPILREALNWVIEHQDDAPGYKRYGAFLESDFDPTLATALSLRFFQQNSEFEIMNKEKPDAYLSWDRRFDIGAAAAEMI